MTTIVLLILMALTKDGAEHMAVLHMAVLPMPPGTTLAECIAEHQPAVDAMSGGAVKFGYRCVEVTLVPTSEA